MHVVLAGIDRLPTDAHAGLHTAGPDAGGQLAGLADTVQPLLADGPVLVVHPSWDPEVSRTVDSLHMALDTPALLRWSTALSPLAASAVGGMVARLTDHVEEPAVLLAGLPRLVGGVMGAALLGSVSRLEHLSPSLGQHMASWLPGGRFLAVASPDARVERLGRKAGVPLPPVVEDRRAVLSVGTDALRGPVVEALTARGTASPRIEDVPLSERSREWWGTDDLVEVAIVPVGEPRIASDLVSHVGPARPCGWCQRATATSPCPWCGHVGDAAANSA